MAHFPLLCSPLLVPLCSPFVSPFYLLGTLQLCQDRPPQSQVACKLTPIALPFTQPTPPFQIPRIPTAQRLTKTTSGTFRLLLSGTLLYITNRKRQLRPIITHKQQRWPSHQCDQYTCKKTSSFTYDSEIGYNTTWLRLHSKHSLYLKNNFPIKRTIHTMM